MITGKRDKLQKLEEFLQKKNDNSRRFLNTIYTGNSTDRIKLLAETGKSIINKNFSSSSLTNRENPQKR
jgi:hypothetical protein